MQLMQVFLFMTLCFLLVLLRKTFRLLDSSMKLEQVEEDLAHYGLMDDKS